MRPSPSDTAILKIPAKPGPAEVKRLSGSKNNFVVAKRYMTFGFTWGTMLRSPKICEEGDAFRRASGFLPSQARVWRRPIGLADSNSVRLRRNRRSTAQPPTPATYCFHPRVNASLLRGRSGGGCTCCLLVAGVEASARFRDHRLQVRSPCGRACRQIETLLKEALLSRKLGSRSSGRNEPSLSLIISRL